MKVWTHRKARALHGKLDSQYNSVLNSMPTLNNNENEQKRHTHSISPKCSDLRLVTEMSSRLSGGGDIRVLSEMVIPSLVFSHGLTGPIYGFCTTHLL